MDEQQINRCLIGTISKQLEELSNGRETACHITLQHKADMTSWSLLWPHSHHLDGVVLNTYF